MTTGRLHPRFAEDRVVEALTDTPVVLVHGPRQSGKTTLARVVGERRGFAYFSFDDPVALAAAEANPIGFVAGLPEHTILDEVQRAPALFPAIDAQGSLEAQDVVEIWYAAEAGQASGHRASSREFSLPGEDDTEVM